VEIPSSVIDLLRRALEEDTGPGDITASLVISRDGKSKARYLAKEDFVLAGLPFAREVFHLLDPSSKFKMFFHDGARINKGDILAEIRGKTRDILAGERVSLNILQRLSGIATLTDAYVTRVKRFKAQIIDTRKTTPCMRFMEKYAVRMGGGRNHRFGLFDGILIKDNHIEAAGGIRKAVSRARKGFHLSKVEVEVGTLKDLMNAIDAGADVVMLDNMTVTAMRKAVEMSNGRVLLEASGGVRLENVRDIAETGVDFISVGALTHSARAVDISLKIVK
jgi:nicotinate-nucleotide pyrophosphorylase (carboxylating)